MNVPRLSQRVAAAKLSPPVAQTFANGLVSVTTHGLGEEPTKMRLIDRVVVDNYFADEWECMLKDGDPQSDTNNRWTGDRHQEKDTVSFFDDDGYLSHGGAVRERER